jgi:hypothetical protein
MSQNDSFLSSTWSSTTNDSPATCFSSSISDVRRSRSRRRRSSAGEHDRNLAKSPRTGVRYDAVPCRRYSQSDALCGPCRRLDLHDLVTSRRDIRSSSGQFITYLDWTVDSTCALCAFLKSMRIPPHLSTTSKSDYEYGKNGTGYHLRAFSGMLSYREYFVRPPTNIKMSESSDTMLAVVPNGLFSDSRNTHQHVYADTLGSVGYILPVAYSSMSPWLTGRPVYSTRINLPLVQEWLQHCKKKHSCLMRFSRPLQLRMIDCKTLEIVTAPPNCNYFALSYVWGGASSAIMPEDTATLAPESSGDLRTAAPVVRDAIEVVQSLGWRYLWVDKYCIPQTNSTLKAEQIGRMDLIYEGAYCTIVAASGYTDQNGLPGISIPRHVQPSFSRNGCDVHFASSLPDPQAVITSSKWNTRAWTFQEALCSARRLVFTQHQVYFECKAMHTCEAVELPLSLITGAHARPVLFRDEWLTGTHRFGALSAFWSAVKAYSQRSMTFESDALIALEGILRRFQASPAFVYNIFGIPVVLNDGLRGDKDALLDPRLFVAGLSWHHGDVARRRKHFPSWTWAGWEGSVQPQRTFSGAGYTSSIRLWVRDVDDITFPWDMFWEGFWRADGKAKCYERFSCLVVEADMFKVQLLPREDQQGRNIAQGAAKTAAFDMVSPYNPIVRFSSVILPTNLAGQSKTTTELWDCILLGARTKRGDPDVMLLRWKAGFAERVWAGPLWPEKIARAEPKTHLPPLLRRKFPMS